MIWKSVRHMLFTEVATWIVFLLVAALAGILGVRSSARVSTVLVVIWFALFLVIYRIRYRRL